MQAQWREEHKEGKIHHSSVPLAPRDTCPSCVDESAYIFWQLWAKGFVKRNHSYCFDWSPLVRLEAQNAFKCGCATAFENKARTYRTSKRKMSAFYLLRTITWHFPWPLLHAGTSSPISNCREWPHWPAEALVDWAHGGWHSSRPITMDMVIKVALASPSQCDWRTLPSRGGCAAALAAFSLYPSGPGHQANHWHKSLDAGGKKKKHGDGLTTAHMKNKSQPAC